VYFYTVEVDFGDIVVERYVVAIHSGKGGWCWIGGVGDRVADGVVMFVGVKRWQVL